MKRNMKRILAGICFLLALSFCMSMKTDKVYAQGAWYEDYTYYVIPNYEEDKDVDYFIMLEEYVGDDTSLHIPATTVIDGVSYRTKLAELFRFGANKGKITNITFEKGVILPEDCTYLFGEMSKLQSVNAEVFDMSVVKDTDSMFRDCTALTKLNVSDWDVSNVTNFREMFCGCEKLGTLDVSKWNTSNVTDMSDMFFECKSLGKINVTNWDVSKVTNLSFMFYRCEKLQSLNLSRWDTSNVTDMFELFGRCYSIRSINVKGWDTSNVTKMAGMFACNYSLESIDLSSFDMSKVTFKKNDDTMFGRCYSLKTIKTPRNLKKNHPISFVLTYGKKTGKKVGSKVYTYMPKGKKSITLVCRQSKSDGTEIAKVTSSKGKISVSWKAVAAGVAGVQYEVQCSTNKNFTDAAGKMVNPLSVYETYSVQNNVTEKTSATFKGLTKGQTYYVRVRVSMNDQLLSDWSKTKKIKVK